MEPNEGQDGAGSAEDKQLSMSRKPGGSIDWDIVFDHPQEGFIPLILQANSLRALEQSTRFVIDRLFHRANDLERRNAFYVVIHSTRLNGINT